ncbi:hypothetical protein TSUD_330780 [Trifolium subterraneum]|nr:hypothetical protein TSUD_330780 [Trifolium subterraneum]
MRIIHKGRDIDLDYALSTLPTVVGISFCHCGMLAIYSALVKVGGGSLNIVVSKVVGLHLVGQQLHLIIMLELTTQTLFSM